MDQKIQALKERFTAEISLVKDLKGVEALRLVYLGKKGALSAFMRELAQVSKEDKPRFGQLINQCKKEIQEELDVLHADFLTREEAEELAGEEIDVTLPSKRRFSGRKHPISQTIEEVLDTLREMGFAIHYTPEIESEYYNYGGLNYPEDHPARDMQDTYYLSDQHLLRSHTTNIQQHIFEKSNPPIRVASPGKCYRNETITTRSHVLFHQVDVLYVDRGVTFADLLATKRAFYTKLFGKELKMRTRPSYFPFVEPGMEVDISCTSCGGKGCRLCKYSGWLEVSGAGMIHPEVLKNGGIDPEEYAGYARGGGIERLAMLKHGIEDIRLFMENDYRFLQQFS